LQKILSRPRKCSPSLQRVNALLTFTQHPKELARSSSLTMRVVTASALALHCVNGKPQVNGNGRIFPRPYRIEILESSPKFSRRCVVGKGHVYHTDPWCQKWWKSIRGDYSEMCKI